MSITSVLIFFILGIMLALGDISMKLWVTKHNGNLFQNMWWYVTAIALYIVALSVYGYMLKYVDFAAASFSIIIFNLVVVAIVGYFFLGDTLSLLELGGILCGLASVFLFTLSSA